MYSVLSKRQILQRFLSFLKKFVKKRRSLGC